MRKILGLKSKLIVTFAVLVCALLMYLFKIPCIILSVTGIKCLGCGMTRALISAVKLDFMSAFSYHKMFWTVPLLYLFYLFDGKLFKNKIYNILLLTGILVGFILNWVFCIIL